MKAGNYWRWLKTKLAAKGIQPVSDTRELKLVAPMAEACGRYNGRLWSSAVRQALSRTTVQTSFLIGVLIVPIRLTVKARRRYTTSLRVEMNQDLLLDAIGHHWYILPTKKNRYSVFAYIIRL